MRTMYDSITAADLPTSGQLVAGYIDGAFAWKPTDWALFPDAVHVRIATKASTNDGNVLDVETGDATPDDAVGWVRVRRAAGADPSIYCPTYLWSAVRRAFAVAQVAEPHYWIAQWDNQPTLIAGAVAKQYANTALTGGHYDASVVADVWPGVDPAGGNEMTDDDLRAAIKRIYAGPDSLEEWIKADVRVMVEQDGETRAAIVGAVKAAL